MKNRDFPKYRKMLVDMLAMATDGSLSRCQQGQITNLIGETFAELEDVPVDALREFRAIAWRANLTPILNLRN